MFNFGVSTHTYDSQIMTCAKTFNKTKTYDSGHTGQETICEVLSKRYEDARTLCSLNTNCFIIKTYSPVFNIDLVFEKKKKKLEHHASWGSDHFACGSWKAG